MNFELDSLLLNRKSVNNIFFSKEFTSTVRFVKPVPKMTIEEIKAQLSMSTVLAHYGLKVNRNKHINCPFHDDKTPSMRVYEETNTVYCFSGNCSHSGKSMDVIELVQQLEKCNKHEAILKCKSMLGARLNLVEDYVPDKKEEVAILSGVEILQSLWTNFVVSFKSPKCKARAYAQSRGLSLEGIGYNTGSRVPHS